MKPQKGDIWSICDSTETVYHFLFTDDGYAPPWEQEYISYNAIHLESGEFYTVFFTEEVGFVKVA